MQIIALLTFFLSFAQLYDSIKSNTTGLWLIILNALLLGLSSLPIFLGIFEVMTSPRSITKRAAYRIMQFLYPDDVEFIQGFKKKTGDSIFCNPFKNRTTFCSHRSILKVTKREWKQNRGIKSKHASGRGFNNEKNFLSLDYDFVLNESSNYDSVTLRRLSKEMDAKFTKKSHDGMSLREMMLEQGAMIMPGDGEMTFSNVNSYSAQCLIKSEGFREVEGNFTLGTYKFRLSSKTNREGVWTSLSCYCETNDENWDEEQFLFKTKSEFLDFFFCFSWTMGLLIRENRTCCFVSDERVSIKRGFFCNNETQVHHCISWAKMFRVCCDGNLTISPSDHSGKKIFEGEEESIIKREIYQKYISTFKDYIRGYYNENVLKTLEGLIKAYGVKETYVKDVLLGVMKDRVSESGLKNWQGKRFWRDMSWVIESFGKHKLKGLSRIPPTLMCKSLIKKNKVEFVCVVPNTTCIGKSIVSINAPIIGVDKSTLAKTVMYDCKKKQGVELDPNIKNKRRFVLNCGETDFKEVNIYKKKALQKFEVSSVTQETVNKCLMNYKERLISGINAIFPKPRMDKGAKAGGKESYGKEGREESKSKEEVGRVGVRKEFLDGLSLVVSESCKNGKGSVEEVKRDREAFLWNSVGSKGRPYKKYVPKKPAKADKNENLNEFSKKIHSFFESENIFSVLSVVENNEIFCLNSPHFSISKQGKMYKEPLRRMTVKQYELNSKISNPSRCSPQDVEDGFRKHMKSRSRQKKTTTKIKVESFIDKVGIITEDIFLTNSFNRVLLNTLEISNKKAKNATNLISRYSGLNKKEEEKRKIKKKRKSLKRGHEMSYYFDIESKSRGEKEHRKGDFSVEGVLRLEQAKKDAERLKEEEKVRLEESIREKRRKEREKEKREQERKPKVQQKLSKKERRRLRMEQGDINYEYYDCEDFL